MYCTDYKATQDIQISPTRFQISLHDNKNKILPFTLSKMKAGENTKNKNAKL